MAAGARVATLPSSGLRRSKVAPFSARDLQAVDQHRQVGHGGSPWMVKPCATARRRWRRIGGGGGVGWLGAEVGLAHDGRARQQRGRAAGDQRAALQHVAAVGHGQRLLARSAPPSARWCRRRRCAARCASSSSTMRGARPSDGSSSISRRGALIMRARHRHHLLLAAAHGAGELAARARAAWESRRSACSRRRARSALGTQPAAELQVLAHRHLREQLAAFGHQRHAGLHDLVRLLAAGPRRPAARRRCAGSGRRAPAAAWSCRRRWGRGSP